MIRLGPHSVLSEATITETLPGLASRRAEYLPALSKRIVALEPPVVLARDSVKGAGIALPEALIVTPTARRLRFYQTVHFAKLLGSSLQVGYYLIGGERVVGGSMFGGDSFGIGRPSEADVTEVMAIVELIGDYVVAPTIQWLSDQGNQATRTGFLGL